MSIRCASCKIDLAGPSGEALHLPDCPALRDRYRVVGPGSIFPERVSVIEMTIPLVFVIVSFPCLAAFYVPRIVEYLTCLLNLAAC